MSNVAALKRELKQERSIQTRQRILDEALKLFASSGFEAVGIRDVAAAAGVTHGLIKYHFGDKDGLWREAVHLLYERAKQYLLPALDPEDLPLKDRLERFLRAYVRYCAHYPEHARLMVRESVEDSERLAWAAKRFISPLHDRVRCAVQILQNDGTLPKIDPVLVVYMIRSAAQAPYMLAPEMKHTSGVSAFDASVVEAHADAVIAMIMGSKPSVSAC